MGALDRRFLRNVFIVVAVFLLASCGEVVDSSAARGKGDSPSVQQQAPFTQSVPMTLTIAHVNDTHGQLEALSFRNLAFRNGEGQLEKTALSLGGFSRLVAKVNQMRQTVDNLLVLHAGDVFQGSLYFTKYEGMADLEFLELMDLDAMALGNHEFDLGPGVLADFIKEASFPLLGANVDVSADAALNGLVEPYSIAVVGGQPVALIGLDTPQTPIISSPGDDVSFGDPIATVQQVIGEVAQQGINKIVVLSHLGYEADIALAEAVEGIDVIVGAHSHTRLGDFSAFDLASDGPYPATAKSPAGSDVCIVQAGTKTETLGTLEVAFDAAGGVLSCGGAAMMLVGDAFMRFNPETRAVEEVTGDERDLILQQIGDSQAIEVVQPDPVAAARLETYKQGVDELRQQAIATVAEDLLHVRVPGPHRDTGEQLETGSLIAPVVAGAFLWKANEIGLQANVALVNAGGVRKDIIQGELTVADVYELMPFGNTHFVLDLTGAELRATIEAAVTRSLDPETTGAFPYLAGARFAADATAPEGQRVTEVQVRDASGQWALLDAEAVYRVATINFIAGGGDGYDGLAQANSYRYDTGFVDAEVFMQYATSLGTLVAPEPSVISFVAPQP